jgi:dipeptidyl-peptidase 4
LSLRLPEPKFILLAAGLLLGFTPCARNLRAQGAQRELTLQEISSPGLFRSRGPRDFKWRPHSDEISYLCSPSAGAESDAAICTYNAQTLEQRVLFAPGKDTPRVSLSSYQWSPEGSRLLFAGQGKLWTWNARTGTVRPITESSGEFESPTFSPSGNLIAFTRKNNIYVVNVANGSIGQLTSAGSASVLDGKLDWVYGEEMSYRATLRAYEWSPDGKSIAYLQLNDGPVFQYPLDLFLHDHVRLRLQRFPQAGDANPVASMHVVSVEGGPERTYTLAANDEYVSPDFEWTPDSRDVCFLTLNRDETRETVHLWNVRSGADRHPVVERDPYWINSLLPPFFIHGGRQFLWLSERTGWIHLYLYTRQGRLLKPLTRGHWMIDLPIFQGSTVQLDHKHGWAYFQTTRPDPRERQVYRVRLNGSGFQQITLGHGTHTFKLSPDGRFLLDQFSALNTPPQSLLLKPSGRLVAPIYRAKDPLAGTELGSTEFLTLKPPGEPALYARLVKPPDFNPDKKYPVIVDVYGGPSIQVVRNQWGVTSALDQLFAEHGFLVWQLDNRGSWGRGHAFETVIFKDMGKHELEDQLTGVRYLESLPYVDPKRIGIWGWSYGGYMTLYAVTHAPNVFKCAVAGAPVTDWHYYDTIYTERYMRTPKDNPAGYAESSNVKAAGHLRAKLLIIHGTSDDNVHLQNTIAFIQALIDARIPYQLYLQPGESHGFRERSSIYYRNMRVFEFFEHNL